MTIAVANVSNTSTFLFWQTVTNQLASAMSTAVITTSANGTTAQTAGNAAIGGTFTANSLVSNTLIINTSSFVGNSTVNVVSNSTSLTISNSTANISLVSPSAAQITNGQYYLNANGQWALVVSGLAISNTVTTSGTTTQTVDQWPIATFRSAEYQVNYADIVANNHYASRLFIMHDTGNAYITEYAGLISNSSVGVFGATITGANVVLQFTPVSTSGQVRFVRIAL